MGITLVIISGGIDLSVGSILAFSGTLCCGFISNAMPVPFAVLLGLAFGACFGTVNGLLVAQLKMVPFIVTLATMQIIRGGSYIYSQGMPIRSVDSGFNFIGNGYIGLIPVPVIIFLFVIILTYLILHRAKMGMYIYAVGGNKTCADFSGVNSRKVQVFVYIICGVFSSLSGIILASRMYSGQPTAGQGAEMDAIAAAVLGGTSFSGGSGTVAGTFMGVLIIGIMNNGLNILNVPFYYQLLLKGVIILLAIYIDRFKK
jgi:ribose transport system permease protein